MKRSLAVTVLVLVAARPAAAAHQPPPAPGPLAAAVAALDQAAGASDSTPVTPRTLCEPDHPQRCGAVPPADLPQRSGLVTTLLGVAVGGAAGALWASDDEPRAVLGPVRWWDGALIGAGLWLYKGHEVVVGTKPVGLAEGRWSDCSGAKDTLDAMDASVRRLLAGGQAQTYGELQRARRRRERMQHLSDITLRAAIVQPLGFTLRAGSLEPWRDAVAYAEALAVSGGLVTLAKRHFNRPRPFAHFCEPPDANELGEADSQASFFSGHTALSFAMSSTGWGLAARRGDRGAGWLKGGGIALSTATALLRIAGDKHYLTDVLVGAAVGLGTGWLVVELHDPRPRDGATGAATASAAATRRAQETLTPAGLSIGVGRGLSLRAGLVAGGPAFALQAGF